MGRSHLPRDHAAVAGESGHLLRFGEAGSRGSGCGCCAPCLRTLFSFGRQSQQTERRVLHDEWRDLGGVLYFRGCGLASQEIICTAENWRWATVSIAQRNQCRKCFARSFDLQEAYGKYFWYGYLDPS